MADEARNHHYVPRFYLNSFAVGEQLVAFDVETGKRFTPNVVNVAQERDFNRVELDGQARDSLEQAYAAFESGAATAVRKYIARELTTDNDYSYVITLVAKMAGSNPRQRETFASFQDNVRKKVLVYATATPERWARQVEKMRAAGALPSDAPDVPYEVIRAAVEGRTFKFRTTTTEHARIELGVLNKLTDVLGDRTWRWLTPQPGAGEFITCDHPVCLNWLRPPSATGLAPIGYGLTGTSVYVPISPTLAMLGIFDGPEGSVEVDRMFVADANRRVFSSAERQIYCRSNDFNVLFSMTDIQRGDTLSDWLKARPRPQERQHDEDDDGS